jgi:hypothetical protein
MTLSAVRLLWTTALLASTATHASSSAFPTAQSLTRASIRSVSPVESLGTSQLLPLRIRGGGAPAAAKKGTRQVIKLPLVAPVKMASSSASATDPAAKSKKVRIQAFDTMRFFLIMNIVLGHFIMFAEPSTAVLKFCSQHNVLVGAFFALSGYVTVRRI